MSMTLNLIDRLLDRGRTLQQLGRDRDALPIFRRVAGFGALPAEAAEEAHVRLAEIHLGRRKYHRARRHLRAALRIQPDNAYYHYLFATAVDAEDTGDPKRALRHYRRSLQLDPNQPDCLLDYGLLNLREGRLEAGLTCLRRVVELFPEHVEAVRHLAEGLILAGRPEEARSVLRAALFRNPGDGRFRQLWNQFEFEQLALEQQASRRDRMREKAEEPVLLPFVRSERSARPARVASRILRQDAPSSTPAPHEPTPYLFNHRDAQ